MRCLWAKNSDSHDFGIFQRFLRFLEPFFFKKWSISTNFWQNRNFQDFGKIGHFLKKNGSKNRKNRWNIPKSWESEFLAQRHLMGPYWDPRIVFGGAEMMIFGHFRCYFGGINFTNESLTKWHFTQKRSNFEVLWKKFSQSHALKVSKIEIW